MSHHDRVELALSGSSGFEGELKGKGELTIRIGDASKAKIGIDYRDPSAIILAVDSTGGLKLGTSGTLTLAGGLEHNLVNRRRAGVVSAQIKLSDRLAASIKQEFKERGGKTSVTLKISL